MDSAFFNFLNGNRATTGSLAVAIAQAVDAGVLMPGDKLPSTREISLCLGISRTTVVRAFDSLIARGYLSAVKGSGTMVEHSMAGQQVCDFRPGSDKQFSWACHYSETAKLLPTDILEPSSSGDFDELDNGAVPIDLLPVLQWHKLHASLCRYDLAEKMSYRKETFGHKPLREAIARFLRRTRGLICDADQVVIYSGPQSAFSHITDLLVKPGQTAVCENPGYLVAREQFRVHGATVVPVSVDANGLNTEALKSMSRAPQWIYTTPSCQDPTGAVLSWERRKELLDYCSANGTAIIEDAWDSDFRYGGPSLPTLFSMDTSGSVIYLYNFWRLLFPLASVAVAVVPKSLLPLFRGSKHLIDRQFPTIDHLILTELINSGDLERHMRRVWKTYRSRRQALIFEMKRCLTDKITIASHGAGMYILARFDGDWTEEQIQQAARSAKLDIAPTDSYYLEQGKRCEFFINFARLSRENVQDVVASFVSILTEAESELEPPATEFAMAQAVPTPVDSNL